MKPIKAKFWARRQGYSKQASSGNNKYDINVWTAYHEPSMIFQKLLGMICQKLPHSCKLTALCHHLNSQSENKCCPGNNGVQQSLSVRLQKYTKHLIKSNKINSGDVLQIKLSRDDTKIYCKLISLLLFLMK